MRYLLVFFLLISLVIPRQSFGQTTDTLRDKTAWNAQWIGTINGIPDFGDYYAVYCYHKTVTLNAKPSSFYIHVSADNHYKLFVNGNLVSVGPVRGDQYHWRYETINIAHYLGAGKNSIAAQVWEEGDFRPLSQNTLREGFILQGNTAAEEVMNTNNTWKCMLDRSVSVYWGYFLAVNGEIVNMNSAPANGWNAAGFDDTAWPSATNLAPGQLKGAVQQSSYMLIPSLLPQRELTYQPITVIRKIYGIDKPTKPQPITIPANTKAIVLLDQTYETNAFPVIKFSGGTGAGISLGYAEALFKPGTGQKGNRDNVNGQVFNGFKDSVISNGSAGQSFSPFNFRTYRYMQVTVQTKNAPLTIDSLYGIFTAYPLKQKAVINTDDPEIKKMVDVGWRTARLNAYENYFTGQYYEYLQYIGDARVQAMVTYFNTDDSLLNRHALNLMDQSRLAEGITLSTYPTDGNQIIPTYSLLYIGMLYDYYMYRNDDNFLKDKLYGVQGILNFFSKYQGADGSVVNPPYWNYVDVAMASTNSGIWGAGIPPFGSDGSSAVIDMQLLAAYQQAGAMETAFGSQEFAGICKQKIAQLKQTIQTKYWNAGKMLYADTKEQNTFSEHANAMAIFTDMVSDADKPAFAQRLVADSSSITRCNIYFKYYLIQALVKAGIGDDYLNWLGVWRTALADGLTTWPEIYDPTNTRSECHAWSCSPNVEFYRTILGVDSYAPGFQKIKIEPYLGILTDVSGSVPHPSGMVSVSYVSNNGKWKIGISLPANTSGIFVWKGVTYNIKTGENTFVI